MAVATGDIIQMTFDQSADGQLMQTIVHFREISAATTPANWHAAAEQWLAIQKTIQNNSCLYNLVITKRMTPIAFDEDLYVPTTTLNGDLTGGLVNNTLAAIVTKRTGVSGGSHRGRFYFGGLDSGSVTTNRLSATGVTKVSTFIGSIMGAFGPTGTNTHLQLGLYSPTIGGTKPFTVAGWQQVTRLDMQTILGNQRRRRPGVGI